MLRLLCRLLVVGLVVGGAIRLHAQQPVARSPQPKAGTILFDRVL